MKGYRENPPKEINGSKVIRINDYLAGSGKDLISGAENDLGLEKSNVLQFFLEDGTKISVRPSGTEPKIKYYFSVKTELGSTKEFTSKNAELESRIDAIIKDMELD